MSNNIIVTPKTIAILILASARKEVTSFMIQLLKIGHLIP